MLYPEGVQQLPQLDARPLLIVVSGPSGAGKGTALSHLATTFSLRRTPTYTTRAMRPGESEGVDYHYVDETKFFELFAAGEIFEYTRTYFQSYYGSPKAFLTTEGPAALLAELDPIGFVRVRAATARRVVGIFVTTSSENELRARLTARGQDDDLNQRLKIRTDQMIWGWMYDYIVFNDEHIQFRDDLEAIVRSELLRTAGAGRMLNLRRELDPTLRDDAE